MESPLEGSRLFLYQMALRLRGTTDDVGSDLRTTIKALRRFGVPMQRQWPYKPDQCQQTPFDPFLFGFANEYQHIRYFRIDSPSASTTDKAAKSKSREETLVVAQVRTGRSDPLSIGISCSLNTDRRWLGRTISIAQKRSVVARLSSWSATMTKSASHPTKVRC